MCFDQLRAMMQKTKSKTIISDMLMKTYKTRPKLKIWENLGPVEAWL